MSRGWKTFTICATCYVIIAFLVFGSVYNDCAKDEKPKYSYTCILPAYNSGAFWPIWWLGNVSIALTR